MTYYEANREAQLERNRNWARIHYKRNEEYRKEYSRNHKEKQRAAWYTRKSLKHSLPASFTADDWQHALDYFGYRCAYCEHTPSLFDTYKVLHQEHHIPVNPSYVLECPNPGYVPSNIVPACQNCNLTKSDKNPHAWLISRFGKRKGRQIEKRINEYFASL